MILRQSLQQIHKDQVWLPTIQQAEISYRKCQSLEQKKILLLPQRLHSTQGWKRWKKQQDNLKQNKMFSWKKKKKDSTDTGIQKMLLFQETFALLTLCLSVIEKLQKHMKMVKWGYAQG